MEADGGAMGRFLPPPIPLFKMCVEPGGGAKTELSIVEAEEWRRVGKKEEEEECGTLGGGGGGGGMRGEEEEMLGWGGGGCGVW